jgi:uncharacterized protein (DUF4415 family)
MSTSKANEEFDYRTFTREHDPDLEEICRGLTVRQRRREAAIQSSSLRIDDDILNDFKQLAQEERGLQELINRALREWLVARGVKELIREELQEAMNKAVFTSAEERDSGR